MREALKGFVKVHATKVYTATGAILASINHNLKQLAGGVNITLIFLFILLLIFSITAQSKVNMKTTWNENHMKTTEYVVVPCGTSVRKCPSPVRV